jgi:hypothetical protein
MGGVMARVVRALARAPAPLPIFLLYKNYFFSEKRISQSFWGEGGGREAFKKSSGARAIVIERSHAQLRIFPSLAIPIHKFQSWQNQTKTKKKTGKNQQSQQFVV